MEFQHISVKLFLKNPGAVDWEALIPVFHRWIEEQPDGELLLDIADYRHVIAGPGVVLIGHYANYSLDNAGGRPGLRYHRKAAMDGTNQDRLSEATQAALTALQRLETDARLRGTVQFNGHEMEISINDRLLAPNSPPTRAAAEVELRPFFSGLFGDADFAVSYSADPRSLFSVKVRSAQAFGIAELLDNLNSVAPASR